MNLMFSAAGRRVSLLRHFKKSMNNLGIEGEVIAADIGNSAPASYVTDRKVLIPRATSPDYIEIILGLCQKHQIKLLTSLIDTDLTLLSHHREAFENIGTKLLLCSEATNKICSDKQKTAAFFEDNNIPSPCLYTKDKAFELPEDAYPLLIKPSDGSSGIGVTKIRTSEELDFFSSYIKNAMIQEFIEGDEYTVDVYVDFHGKIRCAIPRKRLEIRGGEVSKGITVKDTEIMEAACRVVSALPGALGCVTVQCFKKLDGKLQFIEINPRFGGGFPLSIHAGADFPKWILQELTSGTCDAEMSSWTNDLVMLRYDDEIIVTGEDLK